MDASSIFLPNLGILSLSMMPTITIFSLGLLGLLLSMSVFLARNFAQTNKNLEAQLIQVKALSEKTIQQEREKAQLEAENARKTKELEEARQLQLSMLPKTPPVLPHLDIAADTVLFLSDGLEEMFDPQGEILGAARVKALVAEAGQKTSEQVITHLKNAGKAWANGRAQEDDVTMVVLKVK